MYHFLLLVLLVCSIGTVHGTPLDDYVVTPDPHYSWTLVKNSKNETTQLFHLQLTSQRWLTEKEVDKPIWVHELTIAVPKDLKSETAILTIAGGINGKNTGSIYNEIPIEELAAKTGAIACQVSLIPNQSLKFLDEEDARYIEAGRKEDALVAYTWDKYLKTGDSSWPLRLPMTKAVVRSMDAIEEVLLQQLNLKIDGFVLVGKSKRGWTAWTTAAVDKRVKGIIPIVIDLLNLKESFTRHYMAYGNWSPAVKDYLDIHVSERWDDPIFDKLMSIVEPSSYNARYTMPKYIINASGDEFFLPDSSRLYYSQLPGPKHLMYLPNTGHSIGIDLYKETTTAYLQFLLAKKTLPSYEWTLENQTLTLKSSDKPAYALLWQAHNPSARDFRITNIGKTWHSTPIEPSPDGTYKAMLTQPENGWSAYYMEVGYLSPQGLLFRTGTDVFVLPDIFPYKIGKTIDQ